MKMLPRLRLRASILVLLAAAGVPSLARAANCAVDGRLFYLGNVANESRSVWLSETTAGEFFIQARNAEIDRWNREQPGVRLTLSDVVSPGNGGTHRLSGVDGNRTCLLDTRNQAGGISLPPNWRPPEKPPEGVTPEVPIAPTPPIEMLPPIGVTPEVPIAPTPPIEMLPPVGVTPEMPIAPRPPIEMLPPTGVTPEVPVAPRPPIETLPPGQRDGRTAGSPAVPAASVPCVGRVAGSDGASGVQAGPCVAPDETPENEVPLTPGRDLVAKSDWNAWVDTRYLRIDDNRGRAESKTRYGTLTVGVDRLIDSGMAAGIMASLFDGTNRRFSGFVSLDSTGVLVGPYLSYRLSQAWSLFSSATIGTQRDDYRVVSLVGSGDALLYGVNLNALGHYEVAEATFLRPRVGVSYQHKDARSFALSGPVLGRSVRVELDSQSSDSMIAEASLEANRTIRNDKGQSFVPFAELGVRYTRYWPEAATTELTRVTDVDWTGIVRLGGRALLGPRTQVELNASYQSLGVSGLNIWEAALFVSHAF